MDGRNDTGAGLLALAGAGITIIGIAGLFWSVGTAVPPVYWASRQEITDITHARTLVYISSAVLALATVTIATSRNLLPAALIAPSAVLPALTVVLTPTPESLINGSYRPLVVWTISGACILSALTGAVLAAIRR